MGSHEDALDDQLQTLKKYIVDGSYRPLRALLQSWKGSNAYVHNLNETNGNYSQIQCSDLDYLATQKVEHKEPKYDSSHDSAKYTVSYFTVPWTVAHKVSHIFVRTGCDSKW